MLKLFVVYPLVIFAAFWLASDIEFGASLSDFSDNYISIEFPKAKYRPAESPEPWYSFYWNAADSHEKIELRLNYATKNE